MSQLGAAYLLPIVALAFLLNGLLPDKINRRPAETMAGSDAPPRPKNCASLQWVKYVCRTNDSSYLIQPRRMPYPADHRGRSPVAQSGTLGTNRPSGMGMPMVLAGVAEAINLGFNWMFEFVKAGDFSIRPAKICMPRMKNRVRNCICPCYKPLPDSFSWRKWALSDIQTTSQIAERIIKLVLPIKNPTQVEVNSKPEYPPDKPACSINSASSVLNASTLLIIQKP